MIIHKELIQRSEDWLKLKCGKISASKVSAIMGARGIGKTGRTYALELLAQRLVGEEEPQYVTDAMQTGIELEPVARDIYERHTHTTVVEVGGIEADGLWYSPDGLIGDLGLLEIKCPQRKQHVNNLLSDEVDPQYIAQLQFGLMVTGRKFIDFVSFNPDFDNDHAMKIITVARDKQYIRIMNDRIIEFNVLLDAMEGKL